MTNIFKLFKKKSNRKRTIELFESSIRTWTIEDIAKELKIKESKVEEYLYEEYV